MNVEFWIVHAFTAFKSRIQSIASRVTRVVLEQTNFQVVHDAIATETDLALNELSNFKVRSSHDQSETFLAGEAARTEATDDD
jgi:hypothetical protein